MAVTKNDCLMLLADIQKRGIDTKEITIKAISTNMVSIDVIRFINDNREFEVRQFYEKIRKSYNDKHSILYKNIVTSDETDEPKNVLTTLSSLLTQILLFSNNLDDNRNLFLRHSRAEEIAIVLANYFKTFDLVPCIKLLRLIKADLKVFEQISKN